MFPISESDLLEFRKMGIAAAARQVGAWGFDLKSYEELRNLLDRKNPALLPAIDDYYDKLWLCESTPPQEMTPDLIASRDAANRKMVGLLAEDSN